MVVYNKNGVVGTRICGREWIEYLRLDFEPNSIVEDHKVEESVDFYIIKGEGEFIINGASVKFTQDSLISVSPGGNRGIKAGAGGASILVIKHLKI